MKITLEKEKLTGNTHVYNCFIEDNSGNKIELLLTSRKKGAYLFVNNIKKLITEEYCSYPVVPEVEYINF